MSDPLTALMHAVQVTNLLKTLILKKLRERNEAIHFTNTPKIEKCYSQHETDTNCESSDQPSDNDDDEDVEEIESLVSETEDCFLRPVDRNENLEDGFRRKLERILCGKEDNASPRNNIGPTLHADSCVSFSDSRVGSSCISTSDDDESGLSSIAFRSQNGRRKRTRYCSRDQYLLTNNVFSQYSPV
ncbi:hypothetical protein OROHE_023996 [Orobanche hederae]